jgi:hypothetical protein
MKNLIFLCTLITSTISYAKVNLNLESQEIANRLDLDLTEKTDVILYRGILEEISSSPNAGSGGMADYFRKKQTSCYLKIIKQKQIIQSLSVYFDYNDDVVSWSTVQLDDESGFESLSTFSNDLKLRNSVSSKIDRNDYRGGGTKYYSEKNDLSLFSPSKNKISRMEFKKSNRGIEIWNLVPVPWTTSRKQEGECVNLVRIE